MALKWNFQGGVGVQAKKPSVGGIWIFSGTTQSARERGKLRYAYKKAEESNIARAFIKGKNLIVNSSSYTADNLLEYLLPQRNVSG